MFSLNYPSGLVMKYEVKPNGLKFRGWENFRKRDPKFGRELQHIPCRSFSTSRADLSHLKTRAKRDSTHTCKYFAKVTT